MNLPLWEVKRLQEDGAFAGYASVFGHIDSQLDMVLPGAFRKTLAKRGADIKLLWQHNVQEPIGIFTRIEEDERGLYVEGRLLLEVQKAREAYSLLKAGAVRGLSIGYVASRFSVHEETDVRRISELELYEISLVTFPANDKAQITQVKHGAPSNILIATEADWQRCFVSLQKAMQALTL
jgi:HK97 family phage prohead protease